MADHTIVEGFDRNTGILEKTHFEGGDIIVEKTFDAAPHLEHARHAREATAGMNWGEGRMIGHIPDVYYAPIMVIKDRAEREKAIMTFFRENPAFLMFDKALK